MSENVLLEQALRYASWGWYVFPLQPRGKKPLIAKKDGGNGYHDASRDSAQIESWWAKHPKANIGIATGASGLTVIDVDGAEGKALLKQVSGGDVPVTLACATGREGGLHLYYRGGKIPQSQKKGEKIDLRSATGYVVAPPSLHRSGRKYTWANLPQPLADEPTWVAPWVAARHGGSTSSLPTEQPTYAAPDGPQAPRTLAQRALAAMQEPATPYSEYERARLGAALAAIPANLDGRTWVSFGHALHELRWIINGVDIGLELFDAWSSTSQGREEGLGLYRGRADIEKRWASFDKPYDGVRVTVGSIYKQAGDLGWTWTAAANPASTEKLGKTNGVHANPALLPAVLGEAVDGNPLIELNKRYAAIGDVGGKCLILSWATSKIDPTVKVPVFQSFKTLAERYANQYVMVKREGKNGEVVEEAKQLGSHWPKWPGRRSYEGIDLVPDGPPVLAGNVLNLWNGFAVEPVPGDWGLMREHMTDVLAGGDLEAAAYILRFAAWAIQHPGDRAEVALVFRGAKGSGKGTFANALCKIFGAHGLHIYSSKHLVGAFNGHLRNCLMLFADEAFWAGDKQGESVLKGMITEPTLVIEQKGVDAVPWRNCLHVIMAANADWVVPASHDERRYACFNIASKRIGDWAYFEAIHKQLAAGGLAGMLWDLQRVELGTWHPRHILHNKALQEQKSSSLPPEAEWIETLLQEGELPFAYQKTDAALAGQLLEHARMNTPQGRWTKMKLSDTLKKWGCERTRTENGSLWTFKSLGDMRAKWEAKFGAWVWDSAETAWIGKKP